jgi:Fis family transcriptional regulator, factor for inversion stimulation protein
VTMLKTDSQQPVLSERQNNECLSNSVRRVVENYFADLDGHDAANLYDLFLTQVEKPMLEVVMRVTRGNITRAAQILGLNRGTLRNRLRKYGLD